MGGEITLFRCRRLLTGVDADVIDHAGVLVDAATIRQVGPFADIVVQVPDAQVIELDGLVFPGLVDAHSHLRGLALAEQGLFDTDLETWILRLQTATELDGGDEALVAAGDLIATGVTSVQGILHSFGDRASYRALIDDVAAALIASGIRAELMIGVTDQVEVAPASGVPVPAVLARYLNRGPGLAANEFGPLVAAARTAWDRAGLRIGAAPVAPQWCSDTLLSEIATVASTGARLHVHLLESPHQRSWIDESPVLRLHRYGLLNGQLSAAHCVWLAPDEISELAASGVTAVHCPSSNAGLQVGSAPVRDWLGAGLPVALGLDSHPIDGRVDAFAELRAAATTAESIGRPLTPRQLFGLATIGGANAIGRSGEIGRIEPGYAGDLVCIDWPASAAGTDPWEWLLMHGNADAISTVVSSGRTLLRDGEVHCADAVAAARSRSRARLAADTGGRRARQASIVDAVDALRERLR